MRSSAEKLLTTLTKDLQSPLSIKAGLRSILPFLLGIIVFTYSMSNMSSYVLSDPDTLMHIASGAWMLEHHQVPTIDPFSHNTAGLKWLAHEWLAQILMALSYSWGGFYGLRTLVGSLFAVTIAYQVHFLLNRMPAIYALFLSSLCFTSLLGHHLARPHIFTWPLLIIWLAGLLNSVEKGQWRAPYFLAPLMVLWANLHGSFILGLMTIPFFGLEAYLQASKDKKINTIQSWALFLALSCLFSLVTPFGLDGMLFGVNMVSAQFTSSIMEWAPAGGMSLMPIEYWILLLLSMGLLGYLRLPIVRLLLLCGFIHESLAHVRYISILGLATPLLIAKPFGDLYCAKRGIKNNDIDEFGMWNDDGNHGRRFVALAFACLLAVPLITLGQSYQKNLLDSVTAPEAAIEFAQQNGLRGNALNFYNMGGYLIFKNIPVFIDGRADLYGPSKVKEYFSILEVENALTINKVLADHEISWTIFPPKEKIVLFLDSSPEWKRVYEDQYAVIHVRR